MDRKVKATDVLFIGLAFFATYFGAGNLIFPPMLGLQSGTHWAISAVGLVISGIFLPILAIVVIGLAGSVTNITNHVSKSFFSIIIGAIMVFATFVSVPRTAAVAIEMGAQGIVSNTPYVPAVILYFVLTFFFAKNKGNVLDKIGKILTPAMAIILFVLVIRGVFFPIGTPVDTELTQPFVNAFLGGYQTGDVLVSFMMASVFIGTIVEKGYSSAKSRNRVTILAGMVAFLCLLVVYGGLLYMGACGSGIFPADIGRAELLVGLIQRSGGQMAMTGLGIAVILACLTTAVGQVAAIADYFTTLSKNRLNYKYTVVVVSAVSTLIALMGVDKIVIFSTPMFLAMYPPALALLLFGLLRKVIPNDGGYKGAVALTLVYSICEAVLSFGLPMDWLEGLVSAMPLAAQGFGWILPFAVGLLGGSLLYPKLCRKTVVTESVQKN